MYKTYIQIVVKECSKKSDKVLKNVWNAVRMLKSLETYYNQHRHFGLEQLKELTDINPNIDVSTKDCPEFLQ